MDIEKKIEELIEKHQPIFYAQYANPAMRAALTEQAEAYENRIRELEARNNDFERMLVALCAHIENRDEENQSAWAIKGIRLIEQASMLAAAHAPKEGE